MAPALVWVGVRFAVAPERVRVEVPESKVLELLSLIEETLGSNVVSKKSLRTLIGKAMSIASVIYTWRPFLNELYSALHCNDTKAPPGCVWTKQLSHCLSWLKVFLTEEGGCIERVYSVQNFLMRGTQVLITWDASPFGMGATLQVATVFAGFFAISVSTEDCNILDIEVGSNKSQQVLEALAGLIALRLWRRFWQGQRAVLHIRSDSLGALHLFSFLEGSSRALTLIASEFALELGKAESRPDLISHIPGITNVSCDMLSRRFDPNKVFQLPLQLLNAKAVIPPSRPIKWWKSLHGTSAKPPAESTGGAKRPRCQ